MLSVVKLNVTYRTINAESNLIKLFLPLFTNVLNKLECLSLTPLDQEPTLEGST
jgi:hypothetical protein